MNQTPDERLVAIRALENKSKTRPAFEEDDESSRKIEKWHGELVDLLTRVSSLRDLRAAPALAMYIDESQAQVGLTRLGFPALPSILKMVAAPDSEKRQCAISVLERLATDMKPTSQQERDVRPALAAALSDKDRSVRKAANSAISAYGGQAVPMPEPMLAGMDAQPRIQAGYLGFTWAGHVFVLPYGGPAGVGVPRQLPMNDHAKHGLRCDADRIRVLVEEPHPSPFFSVVSFSISDPADSGSIEVTASATSQPVPSAFRMNRFSPGRRVIPLPTRSSSSSSSFELIAETSEEGVANKGFFSYLRVTLVERNSEGRVDRQRLLIDHLSQSD